jgi:hypothetical protein
LKILENAKKVKEMMSDIYSWHQKMLKFVDDQFFFPEFTLF